MKNKKIIASLMITAIMSLQVNAAVITDEYAGYSYESGKINIQYRTANGDNNRIYKALCGT